MIIDRENIVNFESAVTLGIENIHNRFKLHKPTGVIFQCSHTKSLQEFKFFKVAALNDKAELEDVKTFEGKDEKSFFEAVAYFEQLIETRIPNKKTPPPAMGTFAFMKGEDALIQIEGINNVVVLREDLEKVFTPPLNKPYGRLDMTAVDKPEYEVVKSKFALNYNEDATKKFADTQRILTTECAVYDMTPYTSPTKDDNGNEDNTPTPDGVNDEKLSLDKIEGEDAEQMKGSDSNEAKEPQQPPVTAENVEGEEAEQKQNSEQSGSGSNSGEMQSNEVLPLDANNLVSVLNDSYNSDIVSTFRKQERLIDNLNAFKEEELKTLLYSKLNIPLDTPKQQFINTVKELTKTYFQ